MRRAYTIGAPSVFVNKNRLGRFPEFRDQGVGGSNPLSPTILLFHLQNRASSVPPQPGLTVFGLSSLFVGDRVTLELDIPVATARHIWVEAIVRRSSEPCALEFLSLTEDQRKLIRRYCRLQPEEKLRRGPLWGRTEGKDN